MTKLTVNSKPDFLQLETEEGRVISNLATIGPFREGTLLVLKCIAGGGKPTPQVSQGCHFVFF